MKIALTGGIACGKSLVAKFLNELGVKTIDADDIVHELIPDPAERRRLAKVVFADESARRALESRIHPLVRAKIDAFLGDSPPGKGDSPRRVGDSPRWDGDSPRWVGDSPRWDGDSPRRLGDSPRWVGDSPRRLDKILNQTIKQSNNQTISLAIIPLLFETHWDKEYDIICCVTSERATQVARMMATRGYTREEAEARLAAQMPVGEKAGKSHYVIENNGSAEELKSKVAAFVGWLRRADGQAEDQGR